MLYPDKPAAQMAWMETLCYQTYGQNPQLLSPPLDSRIADAGWMLIGYLQADNAPVGTQMIGAGQTAFYGFLAQNKNDATQYLVCVRGTEKPIEWIEDAQFVPIPPTFFQRLFGLSPMLVHQGFWSIYSTMKYVALDGTKTPRAAAAIAAIVGRGSVAVVGHSLGSALSTYLMLDLVVHSGLNKNQVQPYLFASPRTGNLVFVNYVHQSVNYQLFNYERDLVPKLPVDPTTDLVQAIRNMDLTVPISDLLIQALNGGASSVPTDYKTLPQENVITAAQAQAKIKDDPTSNHSSLCYSAMLDYLLLPDWQATNIADSSSILGPNP